MRRTSGRVSQVESLESRRLFSTGGIPPVVGVSAEGCPGLVEFDMGGAPPPVFVERSTHTALVDAAVDDGPVLVGTELSPDNDAKLADTDTATDDKVADEAVIVCVMPIRVRPDHLVGEHVTRTSKGDGLTPEFSDVCVLPAE